MVAEQARVAMIGTLAASGSVTDPRVMDVLGRVPREGFVPRFWSPPPEMTAGGAGELREWDVDEPDSRDTAIGLIYSPDRALAIRRVANAGSTRAGG